MPGAKGIPSARPVSPSPDVFQLASSKPPSSLGLHAAVSPHNYVGVSLGRVRAHMCMYVLYCVSWHIMKGRFSEREGLEQRRVCPLDLLWVASQHSSLCLVAANSDPLCVSLILSGLYYGLPAQWTPIWGMRTPILPQVHQTYCGSLQRLVTVVRAGFGEVRTGDLAEAGGSFAARQSSKVTKHKDGMGERRVIGAMGY